MTGQPYDCNGLGSAEILQQIPGLSYRQLDYWTRSGRLTNHQHDGLGTVVTDLDLFRSGQHACWPQDQVKVCQRIFTLLRCGFDLESADRLAHDRKTTTAVIRQLTEIETDLLEQEQQGREQLVH